MFSEKRACNETKFLMRIDVRAVFHLEGLPVIPSLQRRHENYTVCVPSGH